MTTPSPRRWLAPEVVQTSTMDCGPAALKCLLEGFHVPVSYGRLREACQTDVDGTSIDTIEVVAQQLGLQAQQEMVPVDQFLPHAGGGSALPAMVVVRHADVATHFVVVWRRCGAWLQVMDPALGRRWVHADRLRADLYRHEAPVPAADWRDWAGGDEFGAPLRQRLAALGLGDAAARQQVAQAQADPGWRAIATLDAAARLVQSLYTAGAVARGAAAAQMLDALCRRTAALPTAQLHALIPAASWSVLPLADDDTQLRLRGAVLLRVTGWAPTVDAPPLSSDLAAALSEKPDRPLATVWRLLREDGLLAPLALLAAMLLASGATLLEALLLRGLFDLPTLLTLGRQRAGALLALLAFVALLGVINAGIVGSMLRLGRQLETRLRMALLAKLPRLNDRYFQSRPISDMAERSHGLHLSRALPALGLNAVQTGFELLLTLAGMLWLAPQGAAWALALVGVALAVPLLAQPLLNERDLRARNHAGALSGFYLDALLGLMPVRAHRAEVNVAYHHESLLVAWTAAVRGWVHIALLSSALQSLLCTALAGALLWHHFTARGAVAGSDLMLVFWVLKLPALGARLAGLAQQYPAQRNVLLRLLEPLSAPEEAASTATLTDGRGLALQIRGGQVLAAGRPVLRDIDLQVAAGEHVAIVGASGAGKSSLLGLLLGWYRLAEGQLTVDGQALDGAQIDALRAVTAWVDPAVQIWNRSLLDNLAYASEAEDLVRLGPTLQAARLRGPLERLPQGLQTLLGEGGAMLSGGEGQRVRLARALLASGTRLALLDEPFRGVDRGQRQALLAEARQWWRDSTLLCVTHDVAETMDFDRVLVVHDGRIVEDGAPAALAAQDSRYRLLLDAEEQVRQTLWNGPQWRRLSLQDGRLVDTDHGA